MNVLKLGDRTNLQNLIFRGFQILCIMVLPWEELLLIFRTYTNENGRRKPVVG